ncbi:MAG: hypothetical protein DRG83_04520 [Deltaproteobacteria bacterium]|nr:MAG: hypothetical protein DRG83_04520 [Deltaproteobacteria bacterium]
MSWIHLLEEADFQANFLEELQEEESYGLSEYENCEKEEFFFTPEEEEWLERRKNELARCHIHH